MFSWATGALPQVTCFVVIDGARPIILGLQKEENLQQPLTMAEKQTSSGYLCVETGFPMVVRLHLKFIDGSHSRWFVYHDDMFPWLVRLAAQAPD